MFEASFEKPVRFANTAELQHAFGSSCVTLGPDASLTLAGEIGLGRNVEFRGQCSLGSGSFVESGSILTDVVLGARNRVRGHSILASLQGGDDNLFGPFCFLRDDCKVGDNSILGAHFEAARTIFGSGVKVSHRAFVGDAVVGDNVIIGAGVVVCNWDGVGRQSSHIGADAVIGSGAMLVAPITIGEKAVIGAGSVITKEVQAGQRIIQKRGSADVV